VLYNGFDFRRVQHLRPHENVRNELGIGIGPVVGMVARFSCQKDWETFFEAARLVRPKWPGMTFVAVGGGETLDQYRGKYGQDAGLVFTGNRGDVEDIVQVFDVGMLCTNPIKGSEGIPNVVMEYMALGRPTVVTEGGGVRELVIDGETGFVITPQKPQAVADKLNDLLSDHGQATAMGAAGRKLIKEHFSLESAMEKIYSIYEGILAGRKSCQ